MEDFEQELPFNESLSPASLYVSTRVASPKVTTVPASLHTEDGAQLTVVREIPSATYAPAATRTYEAVLSVPRGRLVKFPERIAVEVELFPASANTVEVAIRPLENVGNAERYGEAASELVEELADFVAGEHLAA